MPSISALKAASPSAYAAIRDMVGAGLVVRVEDFMSDAQRAHFDAGLSSMDMKSAVDEAITSSLQSDGFVYPVRGVVELPRGSIFYGGTLTLSNSVHLRGHGGGQQGGNWASRIKFPADAAGIVVKKGNAGPNENGADGSIIEGVFLEGGGGTAGTAHGVDMQARAKLRDCTVYRFAGNGVNIVADVANRKNANLWALDTVSILENHGDGILVQGGDSNAGTAINVNACNNWGWGINDRSFLGNTYIGCHADGNGRKSMVHYVGSRYYVKDAALAGATTPGTDANVWAFLSVGPVHASYYPEWVNGGMYQVGGAYACDGANSRTVFLGCYSEGGSQPPSYFSSKLCVVIGGLHAAGITGIPTYIVDGRISQVQTAASPSGASLIFGAGTDDSLLSMLDPSSSGTLPYRLKYEAGQWVLNWGNAANQLAFFNRDSTPANGFPRDLSAGLGGIGFPSGYYLGAKGLVKVTPGTAAPTTGAHLRGDRVENTAPSAGGFAGWICTTAGTPGTWKGYGAIEP